MTGLSGSAARESGHADDVRVGIVTALPVEHAAIEVLVDGAADRPIRQDHYHYRSGWMPSKAADRPHRVVYCMPTGDGTRNAAAVGAEMLRSFPDLAVLVVCGIGGGVPRDGTGAAGRPAGVRLGDVVVGSDGIADFGHVRQVDGVSTLRRLVAGLSAALLRADRELQSAALRGSEPWRAVLDRAQREYPLFLRPGALTDPRYRPDEQASTAPAVLRGVIGSGDVLLRDAAFRDELARRHGLLAVEMEAAGIAAAADVRGRHWFAVRGISDYCENATKDDRWHAYASLAAAAYVRGLLAACPPFGESAAPPPPPASNGRIAGLAGLSAVVDALVRVPVLADDYQRRAVLELLPIDIRAQVPDNTRGRLHLVGLVQTLDRHPGGREALLEALATVLGERSAEHRELLAVFTEHWPRS
jgi:nucleoside phosphorylase